MLKSTHKLRILSSLLLRSRCLNTPASLTPLFTQQLAPKSLHKLSPKYLFSNDHHHHNKPQHNSNPHNVSGPFDERTFMNHFLHLSQHRGGHSREESIETFRTLRENINKIQRPNSFVALIHKMQMFNEFIDNTLQDKILEKALEAFRTSYLFNDQGDLIRAVVLVLSLQKINNEKFYKGCLPLIVKNDKALSFFNLLTILESYTYNKWLFQAGSPEQTTGLFATLSSKIQPRELANFAKYAELLSYVARNLPYLVQDSKYQQTVKEEINKGINRLYEVILQLIVADRTMKNVDLFAMTDVVLCLEPLNAILPNLKDKYTFLQKQYTTMVDVTLPKGFQLINVKYNPNNVIAFVKRHYISPAANINKNICSLINDIFLRHCLEKEFRNVETYVYFLLFLVKTDSLNLPEATSHALNLEELVLQERNLFFLAKLLEFFAFCEQANKNFFSPEKKELDRLEKVIFQIIRRLPKKGLVSPALLQIFQLMVALNRGTNEDWKILLALFADKENLKRLDQLEFIIKLIPAGAVKTKNLYKVYSNISITGATQRLKGAQIDPELAQLIERFWDNVVDIVVDRADKIYPDKYPVILFNLVYANLIKNYTKIYQIAKKKLLGSLDSLTPKLLAEIVYSYSRVEVEADELMYKVAEKFVKEKLYEELDSAMLTNLYWGYANAGVWVADLNKVCRERLFSMVKDMSVDTFPQFCYALALNNTPLEPHEFKTLNDHLLKMLKSYSGSMKNFNIQHIIGICSSFNVLKNFGDAAVWKEIIDFLLAKKFAYENSVLLLYYIYVLYVHLTVENVQVPNKADLFQVIQGQYRSLVEHMVKNKRQDKSVWEGQVRKLVSDNLAELFGPDAKIREDDEVITLYRSQTHDLMLVNNLDKVEEVIKKKMLPKLGARELLVPYSVDIIVDDYVIEINGPSHYLKNDKRQHMENGYSALKTNLLKKVGMKYIVVPYYINVAMDMESQREIIAYIKEQIKNQKQNSK